MSSNPTKTEVLIIGAGPAGLATAITLKKTKPDVEVCVIDKAADFGNHNLSGAVLEANALIQLLKPLGGDILQSNIAKKVLLSEVKKNKVLFMAGKKFAVNIIAAIKIAKLLGLGFGQMIPENDYIVSISALTKWFGQIAVELGVEVIHGFAAEDIIYDSQAKRATGVKLVDQGLDREGKPQENFVPGEVISAEIIVLAEGCDGLLTEKFIEKTELKRQANQLYSVGVKELIRVSDQQYKKFGSGTIVHAMGYPLWRPGLGPAMFGGGIVYDFGANHLVVGMIVGADWKYHDFNPQDALTNFKNHEFVKQFIEGGVVVEAGAKMIPEGGYYAIPRDKRTSAVGKTNVLILGDSAGFVNMLKIKGLHNAIKSGVAAAEAISQSLENTGATASKYTELLHKFGVIREMGSAKNFRQTVAKLGPLVGMPLSSLGGLLPKFNIESDYKTMTKDKYHYKKDKDFDKDTFTAMAATEHREEQPAHLKIIDSEICKNRCVPEFNAPCITFCPAGVYETVKEQVKPANSSNCLHCKTCQRKCPFDNIRWTVPEGGGGPRYKNM